MTSDSTDRPVYSPRKRDGLTYEQRLLADLGHRTWDGAVQVAAGENYWYVPGEILLSAGAEDRFRGLLERFAKPDVESNAELARAGVKLRRYFVSRDVPMVVAELRHLADDEPGVRVAPNHVLRGEPKYAGGPAGEPRTIDPMDLGAGRPDGKVPQIAVLDTGIWSGWSTQDALKNVLLPDADDIDVLDVDGDGILDTEAGHGTFICGLVAQVAPALLIDPGRVLDPTGVGTDFSIALELLQTSAPVINLSLGGYTDDDLAPPGLDAVLESLGPDRVVVAAAGNNNSDRPFWPAAFKHVTSVGALDTNKGVVRACFSNYGSWVDVWAPGVDLTSTYVDGHWLTSDEDVTFAGWAAWSGTSFSAPLVAAEVARRAVNGNARAALHDLLGGLSVEPGLGLIYQPPIDLVAH
jgi:subtilisin family serine protease